jgi:hypothetical protein
LRFFRTTLQAAARTMTATTIQGKVSRGALG